MVRVKIIIHLLAKNKKIIHSWCWIHSEFDLIFLIGFSYLMSRNCYLVHFTAHSVVLIMSNWQSLGGFVLVLYSKCGEAAGCVPVSWQRFIRQQKRQSEVSSAGELWRLRFFLRSAERDEQVSQPRRDGDWTRPTGTRGEGGRLGTRGEESWWKGHADCVHGYLMCVIETLCTANAQTEHVPERRNCGDNSQETRSVYTNELKLFISSDTPTKPEVDQLCWEHRLLTTCRWSWCLQLYLSLL